MIGDLRGPPRSAEEDAVVAADLVAPVGRNPPAVLVVVVAAPVEMIEYERDAEFARGCVEHADAFRHDLFADAVAGDHGDLVFLHGFPFSSNHVRAST